MDESVRWQLRNDQAVEKLMVSNESGSNMTASRLNRSTIHIVVNFRRYTCCHQMAHRSESHLLPATLCWYAKALCVGELKKRSGKGDEARVCSSLTLSSLWTNHTGRRQMLDHVTLWSFPAKLQSNPSLRYDSNLWLLVKSGIDADSKLTITEHENLLQ